ncbi:hypothetical protein KPL28_02710 [Clostridium algidicarnis]|uniref:hypothetical protein n=1 Tax=Clostridium algidicarnis TaxID=37659 RepID=UPI001C0AF6F2|nr:hypothetical protein [Clostridium algidicarnis]MBU3208545.1 hypothetical protein [Clostridium algidicarnis]
MINIFKKRKNKTYTYRCRYNENPECYEIPCMFCSSRNECQNNCGRYNECLKCPGLIKEEKA